MNFLFSQQWLLSKIEAVEVQLQKVLDRLEHVSSKLPQAQPMTEDGVAALVRQLVGDSMRNAIWDAMAAAGGQAAGRQRELPKSPLNPSL